MKVTEKQLLIMWDVLKHSTRFVGGIAGYSPETLSQIVNDIINQQSNELIVTKESGNGKS